MYNKLLFEIICDKLYLMCVEVNDHSFTDRPVTVHEQMFDSKGDVSVDTKPPAMV